MMSVAVSGNHFLEPRAVGSVGETQWVSNDEAISYDARGYSN